MQANIIPLQRIPAADMAKPAHVAKLYEYLQNDTKLDSAPEVTMTAGIEHSLRPSEDGIAVEIFKLTIDYKFNREGLRPTAHAEATQTEEWLKVACLRSVEILPVANGSFQIDLFTDKAENAGATKSASYPVEGNRGNKPWVQCAANDIYSFLLTGDVPSSM